MVTRLKPYNPSASELVPSWHVIDAKGKVLGRLATEISTRLMGKDRPGYVPHLLSGDFVVVINASQVKITGQKSQTKVYRRHSQKPGNLKEIPYETVLKKFPERIIEHSVKGMLPKTKLGVRMLSRLKVYAGDEHPHSAQLIGSERRLAALAAGELEAPKKDAATRRRKPKQEAEKVAAATAAAAPATDAPVEEAQEAPAEEAPKTAAKKTPAKKTTGTRKTAATKSTASKSTGTKKAAAPKSGAKSTAAKTTRSKSSAAKSSTSKSSAAGKTSTSRSSSSKSSTSTASRRSTTKPTRSSSTRKSG